MPPVLSRRAPRSKRVFLGAKVKQIQWQAMGEAMAELEKKKKQKYHDHERDEVDERQLHSMGTAFTTWAPKAVW